jgi:hypothetical protein
VAPSQPADFPELTVRARFVLRLGLALAVLPVLLYSASVFFLEDHWVAGWGSLRVVSAPALAQWPRRADAADSPQMIDGDERRAILARAHVFAPRSEERHLAPSENPDGAFRVSDDVECTYLYRQSKGTTPKFDCVRPDGEVLHVKYGRRNREAYAEVAATRLLAALGLGADRLSVVRSVRCYGCPPFPYPYAGSLWNRLFVASGGYREFDFVAVERAMTGTALRTRQHTGWRWDELRAIDPQKGGASRADVDALRLMAVFLGDWDGKSANHRLLCLGQNAGADACAQPIVMLQDVGATFGPHKMNLAGWRARPIWADAFRCLVSMKGLPYDGGTFEDAEISERGRRQLLVGLRRLTHTQVVDLFRAARFQDFPGRPPEADAQGWAAAFEDRVRQIGDAGPCPVP